MPGPDSLVERIGLKFLRMASRRWRAYTDLMVQPYDHWAEWNSGLGNGVYILYSLVRALEPEAIVEIGSARGKSTCAMALACSENGKGKVFAIDPHMENSWTDAGNELDSGRFLEGRLSEYGLTPWCQMIRSRSVDAAGGWSRKIDLLFIDGDHTYEGVRRDFELFAPFLTDRSIVCFHDTLWEHERERVGYRSDMGVPAYMSDLQDRHYKIVNVPSQHGLAMMHGTPSGFDFTPNKSANHAVH